MLSWITVQLRTQGCPPKWHTRFSAIDFAKTKEQSATKQQVLVKTQSKVRLPRAPGAASKVRETQGHLGSIRGRYMCEPHHTGHDGRQII